MQRLFTKDQMWSFAIYCIHEHINFKASPTDRDNTQTFLEAAHKSPMFRNGIFEPWLEENDFKVTMLGRVLKQGVDYELKDGKTLEFKNPIQ